MLCFISFFLLLNSFWPLLCSVSSLIHQKKKLGETQSHKQGTLLLDDVIKGLVKGRKMREGDITITGKVIAFGLILVLVSTVKSKV